MSMPFTLYIFLDWRSILSSSCWRRPEFEKVWSGISRWQGPSCSQGSPYMVAVRRTCFSLKHHQFRFNLTNMVDRISWFCSCLIQCTAQGSTQVNLKSIAFHGQAKNDTLHSRAEMRARWSLIPGRPEPDQATSACERRKQSDRAVARAELLRTFS